MKISFRPHHFLCTLGFQGKGYSPAFVKHYTCLVEAIHDNEDLEIEVVAKGDSICGACPHQREEICKEESKVKRIDGYHSQILGIVPGDVLSWREAKQLIKDNMTIAAFNTACKGCEWQQLGMCEAALKRLLGESK